jgi:hypothetical protein
MDRVLSTVIPDVASAYNRERPHVFARPEAVVATSISGVAEPFALAAQAHRTLDRFVLAIHLAFASTSRSAFQIACEASPVRTYGPELTVFQAVQMPTTARPAVVSAADADILASMLHLLDSVDYVKQGNVVSSLQMAIRNFVEAFNDRGWFADILDLTTALEAALSGTETSDVVLRLCMRASSLLATEADPADRIFSDIKVLYALRSRIVHGSSLSEKDVAKWLRTLSVFRRSSPPGVQIALAVDRLRDLVRRAILARLLFAADGVWPLHTQPPPIDWCLADPARAEYWRRYWQLRLEALGAPTTAAAAPRLADALMDAYPGRGG